LLHLFCEEVLQKAVLVADTQEFGATALVIVEDAVELGHFYVALLALPICNVHVRTPRKFTVAGSWNAVSEHSGGPAEPCKQVRLVLRLAFEEGNGFGYHGASVLFVFLGLCLLGLSGVLPMVSRVA